MRQLKKAQKIPDGQCYVDWLNHQVRTYDVPALQVTHGKTPKNSTGSTLKELSDNGYVQIIRKSNVIICQVTNVGWHHAELTAKELGKDFVRSILCPILVSIAAAILTCHVMELLK